MGTTCGVGAAPGARALKRPTEHQRTLGRLAAVVEQVKEKDLANSRELVCAVDVGAAYIIIGDDQLRREDQFCARRWYMNRCWN